MKRFGRKNPPLRQHRMYPDSSGLKWCVAKPGKKIRTGPQWGRAGHMWRARSRNYVHTTDRSDKRNKILGRSK